MAFVSITSSALEVEKGTTLQLTAALEDADGASITGRPTSWRSSNTSIATVSSTGLVTGVAVGEVTITATSEEVSDDAVVVVTPKYLRFSTIAAGAYNTCGIALDGKTYCWGLRYNGTNVGVNATSATEVPGAPAFTRLGLGDETNCGMTATGKAYCWGRNVWKTIGNTTIASGLNDGSTTPVEVMGGLNFTSISGGQTHMCGVTTTGQGYCWGSSSNGQLGDSTPIDGLNTQRPVPALVKGSHSFMSIKAGFISQHTCGITTAQKAYCWGHSSDLGLIGDGGVTDRIAPTAIASTNTFTQIAATAEHNCALSTVGQVYCWGGSLPSGGGRDLRKSLVPVLDASSPTLLTLVGAAYYSCGLDSDGKAYCWGDNSSGILGDGTMTGRTVPTAVSGDWKFKAITMGMGHTCAIALDDRVLCWGANNVGQLGDGTFTWRDEPVRAAALP